MAGSSGSKVVLRAPLSDIVVARLSQACPQSVFVTCLDDAALQSHLADVEVMIGGASLSLEQAIAAPRLRWVQTVSVGVDGFLDLAKDSRGLVVTNARGTIVIPVAEHAMMLMLSFARGMPELMRRQYAKEWLPPTSASTPHVFELSGARLGLVGYGLIGRAIAERAKAFGMEVWALRRSGGVADGPVDRMLASEGFDELLRGADHLMLITPLTVQTQGMMDARAFAMMKPTAYFYNLGRGAVVDQDAMIRALSEGQIAGAGLEVTEPEPLPGDSPLWSMANVIITGHTAGFSPRRDDRLGDFLAAQLRRYRNGEPLHNQVDLGVGY